MPSRKAIGSSSSPDEKKRWKARSAGENPIEMPCSATTKPAATERGAHAAQRSDQDAGARRRLTGRLHGDCHLCAGDFRLPDTLGSDAKSNRD